MKVKNSKRKMKPLGTNLEKKINTKQQSNKLQWKKIKLSGKLLSDDSGLEGLIGLEVLENYDEHLQVTRERRKKCQPIKAKSKKKKAENSDDDGESDQSRKSRYTEKKQKTKKRNMRKEKEMGRFVRPILPDEIEDIFTNQTENLSKGVTPNSSCQQNDLSDEDMLTSDVLIGWNDYGIAEPILRALAGKGFTEPTEIQALTLPAAILGRRDILGAAETGSGKTLAFGIPIINSIIQMKLNPGQTEFRNTTKNKSEIEMNEKVTMKPREIKNTRRNREDRDNFTPPPEEIDNFPDFVGTKNTIFKTKAKENLCNSRPLYALILTPTRELAVQVKDHLVVATKYTDIRVAAIFGGLAAVKQERILSKCPEIVVATPGRLWELLNEGNAHLNKLQNINFLVVDETDRMIEKGHFEELKLILERLNADPTKRAQRQNFIFSATLTLVHELPQYLKFKNLNRKRKLQPETVQHKLDSLIQYFGISKPKVIDITQSDHATSGIPKRLTECRISCSHDQKDLYLYYFLQKHPGRTIVFCNSIDCVRRLAKLFTILKCEPLALHAKMAQRARLKNLEKFTKNPMGLLVATDVAARGLDIPNVQHVIHYQVPRTSENYIHRSGRAARGNKEGIAILLMEPKENNEYVILCRTLKRNEDLPMFPVAENYLVAVRERVRLAKKIDVEELHIRRRKSDIGWLSKTAKEMDILINDDSDTNEYDRNDNDEASGAEKIKSRRKFKHMKDVLKNLLKNPVFPKGLSYKYPSTIQIDENTAATVAAYFNQFPNQNAVNVAKNAMKH